MIHNNGAGPLNGTLGSPGQTIPVIGTLQSIGQETVALLGSGPVVFHVKTSTTSEIRETYNVIADTDSGNPDRVVVVGAHQACDTYDNNSDAALDSMSDAAAHVVLTLSRVKVDVRAADLVRSKLTSGSRVADAPGPAEVPER